ncbi:MAG: hypothetical protein QF745_08895 [Planctomycetota bacterium]|jgi:hypothetical protein|nr:hypothetical protein [Planctomycetota bacterium]
MTKGSTFNTRPKSPHTGSALGPHTGSALGQLTTAIDPELKVKVDDFRNLFRPRLNKAQATRVLVEFALESFYMESSSVNFLYVDASLSQMGRDRVFGLLENLLQKHAPRSVVSIPDLNW